MNQIIKKDEIIMISSGEYSDYGVEGVMRFLKACTLEETFPQFIAEAGSGDSWGTVYPGDFIRWLEKKGFVEVFDYRELDMDPSIKVNQFKPEYIKGSGYFNFR